jgi:hypothetical protein
MKAPQELLDKIESTVIDLDWDYDGLSSESVTQIVDGEREKLEEDVWNDSVDYISMIEDETVRYILAEHEFPESEWEWEVCPQVNLNLKQAVDRTTAYITLNVGGVEVPYPYADAEYEDLKDIMEIFSVDPAEMFELFQWPVDGNEHPHPERRGNEIVDPKNLFEVWYNMVASGELVFLLGNDALEELFDHRDELYERGVVVKKGAPFTVYNYGVGGGSVISNTKQDLYLPPGTFKFYNDRSITYGVQRCYGMMAKEWDGQIELPKEESDAQNN